MNKPKWSFSRLDTYNTCPYSYYAKYVLKEEEVPNDWATNGTAVHDTMEFVANKELLPEEAGDYYFHSLPDLNFPTMKEGYKEKLVVDCLSFCENVPNLDLDLDKVIAVEREFEIDVQGETLKGFIDLELRFEDGILNRDWKTSSMSGFTGKKLQHKLKQLYLYSESTKEHFGEYPKYLEFYMVRFQKAIRVEFDKKAHQEAIDWMMRTVEDIYNAKGFPQKEDYFFCNNICGVASCEFNGNYKG